MTYFYIAAAILIPGYLAYGALQHGLNARFVEQAMVAMEARHGPYFVCYGVQVSRRGFWTLEAAFGDGSLYRNGWFGRAVEVRREGVRNGK